MEFSFFGSFGLLAAPFENWQAFGLQLGLHFSIGHPKFLFLRHTPDTALRVPPLHFPLCYAELLRHRKKVFVSWSVPYFLSFLIQVVIRLTRRLNHRELFHARQVFSFFLDNLIRAGNTFWYSALVYLPCNAPYLRISAV